MEPSSTPARCACHGCRGITSMTEQVRPDRYSTRIMVVPGDGTITRMLAAASGPGEVAITEECPVCGDSEDPGWIPGFFPPT